MSFARDYIQQLEQLAQRVQLPRVKALHVPPDPAPGATRGEFCALELDDGSLGLSYVLLDDTLSRVRERAPAAGLAGVPALDVARRFASAGGPEKTIGFAAANAIVRWFYDRSGFRPAASADSLGMLDLQPGDHVGMIGLFTPLLPRVLASGARLTVVELKAHLAGEHPGYRVTLDADALQACSPVIATGTLVLNDTLDDMLARCRSATAIALIGPSLGCLPDALFTRGVTLMGGSWVVDGPAYIDALREGVERRGLAEKVVVQSTTWPGFETLLARL